MNQMWAPWRIDYIKGPKPEGCILCDKVAAKKDRAHLILKRGEHGFTLLNLYPYSNGHLMVAPYAHGNALEALPDGVVGKLMEMVEESIVILKKAYKPEGINVGLNLGRAAGAGIDDHLHFHIVPRWVGDTNFMSVVSGVRVIPESLDNTFRLLKPHYRKRK
jgi:ATP adenylyltransferase